MATLVDFRLLHLESVEKAREFCGCRGRNGIILRKD